MDASSNAKATRKSTTSTHLEVNESTFDNPNIWDDLHAFVPEPSPEAGPSESKCACVEEIYDKDSASVQVQQSLDTKNRQFMEAYPQPVGITIGQGKTKFQVFYETYGTRPKHLCPI